MEEGKGPAYVLAWDIKSEKNAPFDKHCLAVRKIDGSSYYLFREMMYRSFDTHWEMAFRRTGFMFLERPSNRDV